MCYKIIKHIVVITIITCAYFSIFSEANALPPNDPGNIDACFKDIECTDNTNAWNKADWVDEVNSICKIVIPYQSNSTTLINYGSGVLINNPLEDNSLYILAAYHSFAKTGNDINVTVANSEFHFNYYNTTCGLNSTRTDPVVLNGSGGNATIVASLSGSISDLPNGSDYILIKLNIKYDPCKEFNDDYNDNLSGLFFAGFDKNINVFYTHEQMLAENSPNTSPPVSSPKRTEPGPEYIVTGLSHPGGDGYDYLGSAPYEFIGKGAPMKVHTYTGQILDWKKWDDPTKRFPDFWRLNIIDGVFGPSIDGVFSPPLTTHTPLDYGVVTGGSSGSPLFYENNDPNSNKYVTGTLTNTSRALICGSSGEGYQLYYGKFSRSWEGNSDPNSSIKKAMGTYAETWSLTNDRLEGKKFDGGSIHDDERRKYVSGDYGISAGLMKVDYDFDCCWEITIDFPDDAVCFGPITVEEDGNGIEIEQTELVGTDPVKFRFCPENEINANLTIRIYSTKGILLAEKTITPGYCSGVGEFDCTCLDAVTVTANDKVGQECCFTLDGIGSGDNCKFYGFQILDGNKIIYQDHGDSSPITNGTEFCIDRDDLGSSTFKLQFLGLYDGSGMAGEVLCENDAIDLPVCDECTCSSFKVRGDNITKLCEETGNDTYCYDISLPLDIDPNLGLICNTYGYTFKVNGEVLKEEFDNTQAMTYTNRDVGKYCFSSSDFDANGKLSIEFIYYDKNGKVLCTVPQEIEIDCSTDLNYEIINQTDSPSCCKTIKFNGLCDIDARLTVAIGNSVQYFVELQPGEVWSEKEFILCDDSNEGTVFEIYLSLGHTGQVICSRFIQACEPVDCCDGFEIQTIPGYNPPLCGGDNCPYLIDIQFKDHGACLNQDVDITFNGNTISYNGTPIGYCILSPGGTISAVTTNVPQGMECLDDLVLNCPGNPNEGDGDPGDPTGPANKLVDTDLMSEFVEFAYVFPNPSSEDVTIHINLKTKGNVDLVIVDMKGKIVSSTNLGVVNEGELTKTIDITSIPVGNYILRLNYENLSVPFPIQITR